MVEVASNKESIFPFHWKTREREAWYYMCNKLGLFDPNNNCHQNGGVWHTWSNFRVGSNYILKRLDRAMITAQSFCSFSEDRDLHVLPLSDVTLSDHYPIYFVINWHTTV